MEAGESRRSIFGEGTGETAGSDQGYQTIEEEDPTAASQSLAIFRNHCGGGGPRRPKLGRIWISGVGASHMLTTFRPLSCATTFRRTTFCFHAEKSVKHPHRTLLVGFGEILEEVCLQEASSSLKHLS